MNHVNWIVFTCKIWVYEVSTSKNVRILSCIEWFEMKCAYKICGQTNTQSYRQTNEQSYSYMSQTLFVGVYICTLKSEKVVLIKVQGTPKDYPKICPYFGHITSNSKYI